MPLIKRYPNRKLYDTGTKQYITLDEIADLIRRSEDVQVIDHASGEDVTTLTLTQIILELERRQAGFLPSNVLAGLVRAGGDTVASIQRSLAMSLDWWGQVDVEIRRRFDELVHRGEISADEASRLRTKLENIGRSAREDWADKDLSQIEAMLRARGIPTGEDYQSLIAQVEMLSEKIEALNRQESASAPSGT
jgi:polyhydroxyalkanoate synthesis repressor PhaR